MVEVQESDSVFLAGMARITYADCHRPRRRPHEFADDSAIDELAENVALRYVDNYGNVTEQYPANPNAARHRVLPA